MIRVTICLLPLIAAAGMASAQDHSGHAMPPAPVAPARQAVPPQAPAASPAPAPDPHAGHIMPMSQEGARTPAAATDDPHAGHVMPAEPVAAETLDASGQADPHAGHVMATDPDPHAGHDMGGMAAGAPDVPTSASNPGRPPQEAPPPGALSGPAHAADRFWGAAAMEASRALLIEENGAMTTTAVVVERLEVTRSNGEEGLLWDLNGWSGGDINRFWWKSEGETDLDGDVEGEVQALYSRAIRPFWDVQAGVGQDFRSDGEDTTHLVLGLQGLAPHWWEVDAAAFLSTEGDLTARVEAEYDQRLTQRLILQPRVELEASASDIPELGLGAGLTHVSVGVRLRYEFHREFAPYLGVEYGRDLGGAADFTRADGRDPEDVRAVIGVRAWF
ncbi:MAG: copper resistance protein B [Brevundimonas sp.]|uniref:copper resistance protein B n=1 Tax=Brevundimonas sp. TaxID=1871086 RepID=UPI00258543ED|nr:copper resistance protein B [Brevundimonas sp.]MCV0415684.1 copper resistance protein B [Brevundimonas sp.]